MSASSPTAAARTETDRPSKVQKLLKFGGGDMIDHDTIHSTIRNQHGIDTSPSDLLAISFLVSKDTHDPLHLRPVR